MTKVAEENNAESILIIHDKRLVLLYTMNWQEHALHSEVYAGRGFNRVPIITYSIKYFTLSPQYVIVRSPAMGETTKHPQVGSEIATPFGLAMTALDEWEYNLFYASRNNSNKAIFDRGEVMKIIEEIKETLRMEIRPNSQEPEYLEAVIDKKDLGLLKSLLKKHLGPAAKKPGKEANLPMEIQKMVDSLGGLRIEQSFFYRQDGNRAIYVALWPWESNPNRITLKSGVRELVSTDL